ncbi:MAG: hypothetical protein IJ230_08155 [Clostridia bacterium]|nr:hypothetical protein [Clostridia bacterium]
MEYEHELGKLYAIGYAQFYFAMYNEKMNSLRMDIMRDRGNTEMVVKNGIDWILENTNAIPTDTPEREELVKKTLVFVVGGAFDYLYDCMIYGVEFDTAFLSDVAMTLLNPYLETPFSEGEHLRAAMTPEWLEKARKKYNRMLFTVK